MEACRTIFSLRPGRRVGTWTKVYPAPSYNSRAAAPGADCPPVRETRPIPDDRRLELTVETIRPFCAETLR